MNPPSLKLKSFAVIGSGPAALMAAHVLTSRGMAVDIFEKRPGPAWKLFVAGSSGLNITNACSELDFINAYGENPSFWKRMLKAYSPQHWLKFIEDLGIATFQGTSRRYFVKTMNAAKLVREWRRKLTREGATWHFGHECLRFERTTQDTIRLYFQNGKEFEYKAVCFALGSSCYEPKNQPVSWPDMFTAHNIGFTPFEPSNVGIKIQWTDQFLAEAEGRPLKNVILSSNRGQCRGDLVITEYGVEGTPAYSVGKIGAMTLDLKPDLSVEAMRFKCERGRENTAPIRRIKKYLNLDRATHSLIFHMLPNCGQLKLEELLHAIKNFPIKSIGTQDLSEAISAKGGIRLDEVNEDLMLTRLPGVFLAGEMLDWDAPTGGFLIQACVTQGYIAGMGMLDRVRKNAGTGIQAKPAQ